MNLMHESCESLGSSNSSFGVGYRASGNDLFLQLAQSADEDSESEDYLDDISSSSNHIGTNHAEELEVLLGFEAEDDVQLEQYQEMFCYNRPKSITFGYVSVYVIETKEEAALQERILTSGKAAATTSVDLYEIKKSMRQGLVFASPTRFPKQRYKGTTKDSRPTCPMRSVEPIANNLHATDLDALVSFEAEEEETQQEEQTKTTVITVHQSSQPTSTELLSKQKSTLSSDDGRILLQDSRPKYPMRSDEHYSHIH